MERNDPWAEVADRFVDEHYNSVRGKVRTYVIDQHLDAHLPPPPASIVDLGGGAGTQSIPLARQGYEVTIVDSSPAMLRRASTALSKEQEEVATRVRLVEAEAETAFDSLGKATFHAVLCHGVLPYVDDPRPLIGSICALCSSGGMVSIVAKNQNTLAVSPALEGRWTEALAAFDASRQVNRLGFDTRADTVEDLTRLLEEHGVRTVGWFGVRLFTDKWTNSKTEEIEDLMAVELEASKRDPYRKLSRLFHLIGVKNNTPPPCLQADSHMQRIATPESNTRSSSRRSYGAGLTRFGLEGGQCCLDKAKPLKLVRPIDRSALVPAAEAAVSVDTDPGLADLGTHRLTDWMLDREPSAVQPEWLKYQQPGGREPERSIEAESPVAGNAISSRRMVFVDESARFEPSTLGRHVVNQDLLVLRDRAPGTYRRLNWNSPVRLGHSSGSFGEMVDKVQ